MINTLEALEEFVKFNWEKANKYIDSLQDGLEVPVYNSVDIRESKTKIAPVDNNVYPAGFNNICYLDLKECSLHFKKYFKEISKRFKSEIKNIAIIPESNTRNRLYLDNLACLTKSIEESGYNIDIISFDNNLFENENEIELVSYSGFNITFKKAKIKDQCIQSYDDQEYCIVLLNNDQSSPIKIDWKNIRSIVTPPYFMGWNNRNKSMHFCYYQQVVDLFCKEYSINPELLQAKFEKKDNVDFYSKKGIEELYLSAKNLLEQLPKGSKLFIKADKGTYGMGISVISHADEILSMNRKQRNKMDIGKNKIKFTSVILQEGIETVLKYDEMPAEVTIYLINGTSVGGFMRANPLRDENSNLNAKGMVFHKFCISEIRQNSEHKAKEAIYSIIARLSAVASAKEIEYIKNHMGEQ